MARTTSGGRLSDCARWDRHGWGRQGFREGGFGGSEEGDLKVSRTQDGDLVGGTDKEHLTGCAQVEGLGGGSGLGGGPLGDGGEGLGGVGLAGGGEGETIVGGRDGENTGSLAEFPDKAVGGFNRGPAGPGGGEFCEGGL
jgi:hypothetical protein